MVMNLLPPLCVVLATFFYGLGIGPVCFALLGELFPIRAKAFCSGIVVAMRYIICILYLVQYYKMVKVLYLGVLF